MLRERGWRIVSLKLRAGSADSYRDYLYASRAELDRHHDPPGHHAGAPALGDPADLPF